MSELKHLATVKENRKDKHVLVKFSHFEHGRAQRQADKYTNGNLSEWLRYCSTLEPKQEDVLSAPLPEETDQKSVV